MCILINLEDFKWNTKKKNKFKQVYYQMVLNNLKNNKFLGKKYS